MTCHNNGRGYVTVCDAYGVGRTQPVPAIPQPSKPPSLRQWGTIGNNNFANKTTHANHRHHALSNASSLCGPDTVGIMQPL